MWDAARKAIVVGLSEPFGVYIIPCALEARHGAKDLMFSLMGFSLIPHFYAPIFPFSNGNVCLILPLYVGRM
jgi:coproporphyrinogen III oxidase